jgi:hypothetical protein
MGTIFPFWIAKDSTQEGYLEIPYTLPQDFTLFILMKEKNIEIWKKKLDWIVRQGGMALINTHPDYMNFEGKNLGPEDYPAEYYKELLEYVISTYDEQYWHVLPKELAHYWTHKAED